jgi:hypothetical protein
MARLVSVLREVSGRSGTWDIHIFQKSSTLDHTPSTPILLKELILTSRPWSTGADSLLPIALAIQDQVKWQVDTGINDSVEMDMEDHNVCKFPEQFISFPHTSRDLMPLLNASGVLGHSKRPLKLAKHLKISWLSNADTDILQWAATSEQAKKWGLNLGESFIQTLSKERRQKAQLACNRPRTRIRNPPIRQPNFDATNEQLLRGILLKNENQTP